MITFLLPDYLEEEEDCREVGVLSAKQHSSICLEEVNAMTAIKFPGRN